MNLIIGLILIAGFALSDLFWPLVEFVAAWVIVALVAFIMAVAVNVVTHALVK